MLGRRRRPGGAHSAGVHRAGGPVPQQPAPELPVVFRLAENPAVYPSTHPRHPGYQVFFTFRGGGEVTVTTPEHPAETSPVFRIMELPVGAWTALEDPDGRPLPIDLCFAHGLAYARWR